MLDETRMRTACFARAPQRCTRRLSKHFLLTFQEVTPLSKTRNQLYDKRFEESRLPQGEVARYAYAEQIGKDGLQLLNAMYHGTAPCWLREVPIVAILRRTEVYQYYKQLLENLSRKGFMPIRG